jgi:hypothetical protein
MVPLGTQEGERESKFGGASIGQTVDGLRMGEPWRVSAQKGQEDTKRGQRQRQGEQQANTGSDKKRVGRTGKLPVPFLPSVYGSGTITRLSSPLLWGPTT